MNRDLRANLIREELKSAYVWTVAAIVVSSCAVVAHKLGYIDGTTVTRFVTGSLGLLIAWSGNRMPKLVVLSYEARRARRMAGICMTLSGLVYAALWVFAPIPIAAAVGTIVLLAGVAMTLGYCLFIHSRTKSREP